MKTFLTLISALFLSANAMAAKDWRKDADTNTKLNNLISVMPSASEIMLQMGQRYRDLYWAGKLEKWQFAEYQIEEMTELVEKLIITRPKRAATAKAFLGDGFKDFKPAIAAKDNTRFAAAFEQMRQQCMVCHAKNDHAFIVLPAQPQKSTNPVLDP